MQQFMTGISLLAFCNTNQIIWHCASPFEFQWWYKAHDKRATIISIYRILLYHRCNQLRNIWYFRKFVHARFVIYQTIAAIYDWEMSNQPQMCFGKYCAVFNETKSIDIFYVCTVLFDIRRGRWNTNWDCKWKKMITFFNEISAKIVWV